MRRIEQSPDVVADEHSLNDEERSQLREIGAMTAGVRETAPMVEQAAAATIAFELDSGVLAAKSDDELEEMAVGVVRLLAAVRLDRREFDRLLRLTSKLMPVLRDVEVGDGFRPKEVLELASALHAELVARSVWNPHLVAVANDLEAARSADPSE